MGGKKKSLVILNTELKTLRSSLQEKKWDRMISALLDCEM